MSRSIPSLKARPEWLPGALYCIEQFSGNYEDMVECIVEKWKAQSHRIKAPSRRNSLRAVFGPTLRHLQLIMGEGDEIRLMSKGRELLKVSQKEGKPAFKRALATHLVKLDKERWIGVIFELKRLGAIVSHDSLLNHLQSIHADSQLNNDKLRKFINYYAYVGLLNFERGLIKLRQRQLHMVEKGLEPMISEQDFVGSLLASYKTLGPEKYGSPYVPIPELREAVCEEMYIWPDDFDKMLKQIPKESSHYLIHLTQPMSRKAGGIKFHEKYLYYIAIIFRGSEEEK